MMWFLGTAAVVSAVCAALFDRAWVVGMNRRRAIGYSIGMISVVAASAGIAWLLLAILAVYSHLAGAL